MVRDLQPSFEDPADLSPCLPFYEVMLNYFKALKLAMISLLTDFPDDL